MTPGTVQNKDAFLNKIAGQLGRDRKEQVTLPAWQHQPQWKVYENKTVEGLAHAFKENSEAKSVRVVETDKANLAASIQEVIHQFGGGPIVTTNDARFSELDLEAILNADDTHVWNAAIGQENIEIAKKANIGLFFSEVSLAESGTVVQFNDKDIARSVSLLPLVYVAIVPKSSIVPRMTQATHAIHQRVQAKKDIPTCINFISGPSNSADIEMDIVIGVHGPVEAVHVIVTDQ